MAVPNDPELLGRMRGGFLGRQVFIGGRVYHIRFYGDESDWGVFFALPPSILNGVWGKIGKKKRSGAFLEVFPVFFLLLGQTPPMIASDASF